MIDEPPSLVSLFILSMTAGGVVAISVMDVAHSYFSAPLVTSAGAGIAGAMISAVGIAAVSVSLANWIKEPDTHAFEYR